MNLTLKPRHIPASQHDSRTILFLLLIAAWLLTPQTAAAEMPPFNAYKFDPYGLHITAHVTEGDSSIPTSREETWFFGNASIYVQHQGSDSSPSFVLVKYNGTSAPDGDAPVQAWGELATYPWDSDLYPGFLIPYAPLWYLHEMAFPQERSDVSAQPSLDPPGTLVTVTAPIQSYGVRPQDKNHNVWHYLVQNNRVVGTTWYVSADSQPPGRSDEKSELGLYPMETISATQFDDEQSTIPRKLTLWLMQRQKEKPNDIDPVYMVINSVQSIPDNLTAQDVVSSNTVDLSRNYKVHSYQASGSFQGIALMTLDGQKIEFSELTKSKMALINVLDSMESAKKRWDSDEFITSESIVAKTKEFFNKYRNEPAVAVFSVALDMSAEQVRRLVKELKITWPVYVSAPAARVKLAHALRLGITDKRPELVLISGTGKIRNDDNPGQIFAFDLPPKRQITIFGSDAKVTKTTSFPDAEMLAKDALNAHKAGGYARSWFGPVAVKVLANPESMTLFKLDKNLEEDYEELLPPPIGLPLRAGMATPVPPPTPTPRPDWKTLPNRFGVYHFTEARTLDPKPIEKRLQIFFDDQNLKGYSEEEPYPESGYGMKLQSGKDFILFAYNDFEIEIYVNNTTDSRRFYLSDRGAKLFNELFQELWTISTPAERNAPQN